MMKRILAVVLVSTLFTGCAQLQDGARRYMTSPAELAVEDCNKMGFKSGTQSFQNCVLTTSQSIRNARAQQAAASEAARISAERSRPRSINCTRTGSYVNCTEF
jgi:hypothetical protein